MALFLLAGAGITAQAQNTLQATPAKMPDISRNEKAFNEKSAALSAALTSGDYVAGKQLAMEMTYMLSYRGDELLIAKAPKTQLDLMREMAAKMKLYSTDVAGKKTEIQQLLTQAKAVY